jgi:ATP-dependent DNA ligase
LSRRWHRQLRAYRPARDGSTKIKFDGYRVQVHLANEAVKIFTRRGHDWTHRFKKIAHDAWHIKAASAIIDREIVVPAADGTTDFKPLIRKTQPYARKIAHRGIWVEPQLLAEIEYRVKSAEGKVRHPFYKGLREDL